MGDDNVVAVSPLNQGQLLERSGNRISFRATSTGMNEKRRRRRYAQFASAAIIMAECSSQA